MPNFIDIVGKKFNRLYVVERIGTTKSGDVLFRCRCDCGNETILSGYRIRNSKTKSCGCFHKDKTKSLFTLHGKSKTKIYNVWCNMKERCYNKKSTYYKDYGGRGIQMCRDWKIHFDSFYNWSVENGYKEGLTIDRINNESGYSPSNCRWATIKEQCRNRRNNHIIEYNGESLSVAEWSEITGIKQATILYRDKNGWSPEKTLGYVK